MDADSLDDNDHLYEAEYDILVDKLENGGTKGILNVDEFDCDSIESDFSVRTNEFASQPNNKRGDGDDGLASGQGNQEQDGQKPNLGGFGMKLNLLSE